VVDLSVVAKQALTLPDLYRYYNQGGPKHSHMKIWGSAGWLEMNFEPIANDGAVCISFRAFDNIACGWFAHQFAKTSSGQQWENAETFRFRRDQVLTADGSGRERGATANPPVRARAPLRYSIYADDEETEFYAPDNSEGGYTPFVRQCLQSCVAGGPAAPVSAEEGNTMDDLNLARKVLGR
jgi:hypothetical protein